MTFKFHNLDPWTTTYTTLASSRFSKGKKIKDLLFTVNGKDIIGCIPVDFERIKYNNNLNWKIILEVADQFGININNAFIPKNVEIKEQRFK